MTQSIASKLEAVSRPTFLEIDLESIRHNYRVLKRMAHPAACMAVVKANAYGHGLVEIAAALAEERADFLGVALLEEAIELRRAGITAPIHVFGGIFSEQIDSYVSNGLDITASSIDKLRAIDASAAKHKTRARVHLKVDTGMGRIGVNHRNAGRFFEAVNDCKQCDVIGVFSHLASAEENDPDFTHEQIRRFNSVKSAFAAALPGRQVLFHLANSAGTIRFKDSHFDMVRCGLALYGVNPVPGIRTELRSALTLKSTVVYFKAVEAGTPISYGGTWRAPKLTRIVTIPIGYGDGFFRRLSNRGSVLIRGKRYPIVGRVCMDQMMVDVGMDEAFNGDEVVLLGRQGSEEISVGELASILETTEHEVLTSTNLRVPRIYHG